MRMFLKCFPLVGIAFASVATPSRAVDRAELVERANAAFGLLASEVTTLHFRDEPGVSQRVTVSTPDKSWTLDIAPYSVRADGYEVRRQLADGTYTVVEPGPVRTFRGRIEEVAGSVVAGSIIDGGLTAVVSLPEDGRYWIEPLGSRVVGAGIGDHAVYRDEDVIPSGASCGAELADMATRGGNEPPPEGSGCGTDICVTELACDSDVEYFDDWGENVESRINLITNTMNMEYEQEVGITHAITAIIVRPTEPDPYSSSNNGVLLGQFQSHWLQNQQDIPRDVAQLFTGRNIDGNVIGTALTIGGICTNAAFCFVQSDCCGSFACATDLSAHELGHLWNGFHCDCPGWTMNPVITCANQFHPGFTVPGIVNHRNSRACLSDLASVTTFPFEDDFVATPLDPALWLAENAAVDAQGDGEPSGPFSMHLNGDDRPTTAFMDASGIDRVAVEYWWQRTGLTGQSPEPGEDLIVEYLSEGVFWREVDRQPGAGPDDAPFEHACVSLPEDASNEALQVRIRLDGAESNDHFFVDDVRVFDASDTLSIVSQPQLECTCLSASAEFHVETAGDPPFAYQWRVDGVPIPGATEDTLVVTPDGPEDFASYSVEISNLCASIVSDSAQLLEATPIQITLQPQPAELAIGDTLALTVAATGGCNTFQWFFNDVAVPGAVGPFLFIPNVQCADQGCYRVEIANDCGMVLSDIAEVTIEPCGPVNCSLDATPPIIIHGNGLPGETNPFTGFVDPRSESDNGTDFNLGITQLDILFSEPVEDIGGDTLTAGAFAVTETGSATPPTVVAVDTAGMPLVTLTLDRPISVGEWTTIRAAVQDLADTPNEIVTIGDLGPGVPESDRIDIGFLPGDVDQSGGVNPLDLLKFKQFVNGVQDPPMGTVALLLDIDRNGGVNPLDLLAFKRLINGIPPSTQAWASASLNNDQP